MGTLAVSILERLDEDKKITFEEIQKLYKDKTVKEVDFVSENDALYLTQVVLKNGEYIFN
ncbi:MAG: hypothetical protein HQK84_01835 [Nitrospinae bacterium]|nr:hypothetical protein [Nitrospinota bacterium]